MIQHNIKQKSVCSGKRFFFMNTIYKLSINDKCE